MGGTTITVCAAGLAAGLTVGAAAAGYHYLSANRLADWGANTEEEALPLPGDDLVPAGSLVTTRAVSVSAPAACIWPWLVQLGSSRGGFYAYDWVQNLLGLDTHSAEVILPQFQKAEAGDVFSMGNTRWVMVVETLEPERTLTLSFRAGPALRWVSSFALLPQFGSTRLVTRNSITLPASGRLARLVRGGLLRPAWMLFERKMLLGIKDRAERYALGGVPWPAEYDFARRYTWAGEHL
jgi:hypothetical protein